MESISKDVEKHLIFAWQNATKATKDPKTTSTPYTFYASSDGSFYLTLEGINAVKQIIFDFSKIYR